MLPRDDISVPRQFYQPLTVFEDPANTIMLLDQINTASPLPTSQNSQVKRPLTTLSVTPSFCED